MRHPTFFVIGFAALAGCSSSDKAAPSGGTGGAPPDAGHEEAGVHFACKSPMDVLSSADQQPTGFVSCANAADRPVHRTSIKACTSGLPRPTTCHGVGSGTDAGKQEGICASDADCTLKPEGYCTVTARNASCACYYGCKSDSDCPTGNICECGNPTGQCVLAHCTSDADCGPGKLCLSGSDGDCGTVFACQTPDDQCAGDADCTVNLAYSQCVFNGTHRVCNIPKNCGL